MNESIKMDKKMENWKPYYIYLEALFYFFQGLYMSGFMLYIFNLTNIVWALDLKEIGLVMALIGIPMFLKMFPGLLSDRVPIGKLGRRKPYIMIGGLLFLPSFIAVSLISDFGLLWMVFITIATFAWVLVDGTLDALTVDITPDKYTAKMQGAANSGRFLGMAVGGVLTVYLGEHPAFGWNNAIIIIGAFATLQAVIALFFKEPKEIKEMIPLGKVFKKTFGHSISWLGFLFSMIFLGAIGFYGMLNNYLIQEGIVNITQTAYVTMVYSIGVALGAILFGSFATKFDRNIKFYWISTGIAWVLISSLLIIHPGVNLTLLFIAQFLHGFGAGIITVITYSIVMKLCPESIEGFIFATMTSFMNIGQQALAPNIVANLEPIFGMIPSIFFMIIFSVIGLLLTPKLIKEDKISKISEIN